MKAPAQRVVARVGRAAALSAVLFATIAPGFALERSEVQDFEVRIIARGLDSPWGLAFLPDGSLLVTERLGRLRMVNPDGTLSPPLSGLPTIGEIGQGGLLDVALHPQFADNRLIYLSYAAAADGDYGTEVAHARLTAAGLEDLTTIFRALPKSDGGRHFGSRLLFLPDGSLLITLGDRGDRPNGQNLGTHPGSIIRIHDDGSIPPDNPFVALDGVRPEIYTFGNRNVQGIDRDPLSGVVWANEHGPQGGCEVNRIEAGNNYGWAEITYGRNYGSGTRIGAGETRAGVAPPLHQWTPSIAPSGLTVYRGERFPAWQGNLFSGSLKFRMLSRLVVEDNVVVHEERLLDDVLGRIRDVRSGPDGYLYLLVDARDGLIARLEPVAASAAQP